MKRAIKGLLVTSVLLAGCGNPIGESEPADPGTTAELVSQQEMKVTGANLSGICNAIVHYGMPLDSSVQTHVRERLEPIFTAARAEAEESDSGTGGAHAMLENITVSYDRCDPMMASEIRTRLTRLDPMWNLSDRIAHNPRGLRGR